MFNDHGERVDAEFYVKNESQGTRTQERLPVSIAKLSNKTGVVIDRAR
jgi:hypothetical protein